MIGSLPMSLNVGGKEYAIRADYREILNIFEAFNDSKLTDEEKAYVCLKCLYVDFDSIMQSDYLQEAVDKAYWFCDGGDCPKSEPEQVKTLDWRHDESIIFPAVNKSAGFEVRSCEFLHWWSFLGIFGEIDEGLFSTVMNIRTKKVHHKPLEKWEKEFYVKNKRLINITTSEDEEGEKADEAFLNELLGIEQ